MVRLINDFDTRSVLSYTVFTENETENDQIIRLVEILHSIPSEKPTKRQQISYHRPTLQINMHMFVVFVPTF